MPKKKYMFFMLIPFCLVALFFRVDAHVNELPLLSRVIFVVPGHGD